MRTLLINEQNQTVTEFNLNKGLKNIYAVLECETIEAPGVSNLKERDIFYCDEEALLKQSKIKGGFMFPGWSYPIVGKALVVGTDDEGEDIDCTTNPEDLSNIIWISREHALAWAKYVVG